MTIDDGHAVHYTAVERGTPVYGSDEVEVGKVVEVLDNYREHIFDGIVLETPDGVRRFVDAPEVARTAERAVTLDDHRRRGGAAAAARARAAPVRAARKRPASAAAAAAEAATARRRFGHESTGEPQTEETTMAERADAGRENGGGVATARDSLTVTDNRTGETYEVEITDGTVKAMDFRQIKVSEDDFGLMTYDPAFTNTASCRSAITYIDGEAGVLEHRGYPIEQLCEQSTYLEVAYLLIYGELPTSDQLDTWIYEITHHTYVHENIKKFVEGFRYDAHPMGMLLATVGALSTFYPAAKNIDERQERHMAAVRLIAKMPTLAAFAYRHNLGLPYVYPDNDLSYPGNFLSMMFKMTEVKYEPDPRLERALDVLWILHADHEQNCSTSAVRAVGSSQVDPYSARRRRRGRALRAAARRRQRGGAADARPDRHGGQHPGLPPGREGPQGEADGLRPPRLQELRPARADHQGARGRGLRGHGQATRSSRSPIELEKRALDDDYFTERKLYPNVDFYSGLIYEALNLPTDMFTVMFAIPRTSGWIAQWLEMVRGRGDEDRAPAPDLHGGARARLRADRAGREALVDPPVRRDRSRR